MVEISAAVSSFGALKDAIQSWIKLRDTSLTQEKKIEFQSMLIDAQTNIIAINDERSALIKRVAELEKEIMDLKTWDAEKDRYELKQPRIGSFVYALKQEFVDGGEPAHWICPHCYQQFKKSILQTIRIPNEGIKSGCLACGNRIDASFHNS